MTKPHALSSNAFTFDPDWIDNLGDRQLVYFLLNVGDADAQVLVLPPHSETGSRRVIVVDAGVERKVPELLLTLAARGVLPHGDHPDSLASDAIAAVVATHPHFDHIAGMPELFRMFGPAIAEFWDPGYYHPSSAYHETMAEIAAQAQVVYMQPTSGLRRWFDNVDVTVLAPAIGLRNRFDSYGVEINNASLLLRIEYPASRVVTRDDQTRELIGSKRSAVLILGADAQTDSWAFVANDFPYLPPLTDPANKAIRAATGSDALRGAVLKISHHGSKHGVNLELVERVNPRFTLISSVGGAGKYNFPHSVAQNLIREALQPDDGEGTAKVCSDFDLGIQYTSDTDDNGDVLGSIAMVLTPSKRTVYRLGDNPQDAIDFTHSRRMS